MGGETTMKATRPVALVTGGAQGIGKAIVEVLIRSGHDVAVADLSETEAEKTAAEYHSEEHRCLSVGVNVADRDQTAQMVERVTKEWGRLDVLVNNAGVTRDGLLMRMKDQDWDFVIDVNLKGTYYCTKAALPFMTRQRNGRIVSIASIVGVMGNAGQANYAASKAGIIGLMKTVAREYASRGITANAVAPGFIDTAMTRALPEEASERLIKQIPLGRLGTVKDVAEAVGFLVSEEASYITGQVIHVNGGMLMA
jgi:3-oxoacyl-[acyl-carrier protein] reductase